MRFVVIWNVDIDAAGNDIRYTRLFMRALRVNEAIYVQMISDTSAE